MAKLLEKKGVNVKVKFKKNGSSITIRNNVSDI